MDITELDDYNLGDAVKFNTELNPRLWGQDQHLLPQVRRHLLTIADDFRESLGVNDFELKDITISGSNAAYTYTAHSDIDLHLIVDLPRADVDEVYRELFDAKKYQYNDTHNITIGGYDVELYVQNANQAHTSQGIYSIVNNTWIDVPKRRKTNIDDVSTRSKYEDMSKRIEQAIATENYKCMADLMNKIKDMRNSGLRQHGEFSPENLTFKMLRTQGHIQRLVTARTAAKDQELSLVERKKKKVRYGYGSYWNPGYGYYGNNDVSADGGGDGGGGVEEQQQPVATTPPDTTAPKPAAATPPPDTTAPKPAAATPLDTTAVGAVATPAPAAAAKPVATSAEMPGGRDIDPKMMIDVRNSLDAHDQGGDVLGQEALAQASAESAVAQDYFKTAGVLNPDGTVAGDQALLHLSQTAEKLSPMVLGSFTELAAGLRAAMIDPEFQKLPPETQAEIQKNVADMEAALSDWRKQAEKDAPEMAALTAAARAKVIARQERQRASTKESAMARGIREAEANQPAAATPPPDTTAPKPAAATPPDTTAPKPATPAAAAKPPPGEPIPPAGTKPAAATPAPAAAAKPAATAPASNVPGDDGSGADRQTPAAAKPGAPPAPATAVKPGAPYLGSAGSQDIQKLNPAITDVNKIKAGTTITLPGGTQYQIKPGDTLDKIAAQTGAAKPATTTPPAAAPKPGATISNTTAPKPATTTPTPAAAAKPAAPQNTTTGTNASGTIRMGKVEGPVQYNGKTVNPGDPNYATASQAVIQAQQKIQQRTMTSQERKDQAEQAALDAAAAKRPPPTPAELASQAANRAKQTFEQKVNETQLPVDKKKIISRFVDHCVDELKIKTLPRIRLKQDPEWSRRNGTFGNYDAATNELTVSMSNRHILDVLRTVAHELVHHGQEETAPIPDDGGETGSHYENEANAVAGQIMRDFVKDHSEYFQNG